MISENSTPQARLEYDFWQGIRRNLLSIAALIQKHKLDPHDNPEENAPPPDVRLLK